MSAPTSCLECSMLTADTNYSPRAPTTQLSNIRVGNGSATVFDSSGAQQSPWMPIEFSTYLSPLMLISCLGCSRLNSSNMLEPYPAVAAKIVVLDGTDTHYSATIPTIQIRHPLFGFNNQHSPPVSNHSTLTASTCLWHLPLSSDTHHSALMPTTQLRFPPLGSDAHHLDPAPTSRLRWPLLTSVTQHSTSGICRRHIPAVPGLVAPYGFRCVSHLTVNSAGNQNFHRNFPEFQFSEIPDPLGTGNGTIKFEEIGKNIPSVCSYV